MSTPWTITRFIRWRIRDWVCCFLACRLPLGNELHQLPSKNTGFRNKDGMRSNKANKNLTMQNTCRKERLDITRDRNNVAAENKSDESSWPHFQDEDYIVFCFREDGAFEVVKDCKSGALERFDSNTNKNPRPVNRKLNYGEVAEAVRKSSNAKQSQEHGNEFCLKNGEAINLVEEVGEDKCSCLDIKSPSVGSIRSCQLEEMENCRTVSVESTDSNQSDGSRGSFSFPILHWELKGSPVQMPRSEGLYIRKQKVSCARFHCCRF